MKEIDYVIWQEGNYYVAQCLNINFSSFGETFEEAIKNLKEAAELYFENENIEIQHIDRIFIGREKISA